MAIAQIVSAEQYLRMTFEHDAEFVEGRIVERPMPTFEHSYIQNFIGSRLEEQADPPHSFALTEQRIRVRADKYRLADVCVVERRPPPEDRGIVTAAPHLCVEILSPDDEVPEMLARIDDYLDLGTAWVWVVDPLTCQGQVYTAAGASRVKDMIFKTDRFTVNLAVPHHALSARG
jgi:Uma2 family endonuclease